MRAAVQSASLDGVIGSPTYVLRAKRSRATTRLMNRRPLIIGVGPLLNGPGITGC